MQIEKRKDSLMRCPQCNCENPDGAKFCTTCGAPFMNERVAPSGSDTNPASSPAPTEVRPAVSDDASQQSAGDIQNQTQQARKKSRRKIPMVLFIVLVILALAATAFGAYYVYTQILHPQQEQVEQPKQKGKDKPNDKKSKREDKSESNDAEKQNAQKQNARQKAIDNAKAAGKTVLPGTIRIFETDAQMTDFQGIQNPNAGGYECGPYAVFAFDSTAYVTAGHGDGSPGSSSESASMVLLAQGSDVDAWTSYDGKHVTCALGAMWWPSDTGLPLGEPRALRDVQVLLDDGEEFSNVSNSQSSETSTSASSSSAGDYILPDSSTRLYSASELQSYSQYELMLARNEIYARHGRGFNDQEIRQYFQSKSWYQQRYTAEEFDSLPNSPLTSIEQQNIKTIYDVEHSK